MRELPSVGNRLFVAFCYRHLSPVNCKEIANPVTDRDLHSAQAPLGHRWQGPGSVVQRRVSRWRDGSFPVRGRF